MNNQPLNNQSIKAPRRGRKARLSVVPLLVLVAAFHIGVGLLLSIFSPPFWVWPLALGGTLIQVVALAGPRALSSLSGIQILLSRWLTCLGVGLSVVALSIAVGFGGTNDIDAIQFAETGTNLFLINLGVLLLTGICSLLIAYVGDRLLETMGRSRCALSILGTCFLGLVSGVAIGMAIAS